MAISVVTQATAATGVSTRSPAVTFSGYTPVLGDVVALWAGCLSTTATYNGSPAGWTSIAGSTVLRGGTQVLLSPGLFHVVDATDVSGGTTTYTATNYCSTALFQVAMGCVLRGVDTTDVIDQFDTQAASASTTHVIPGAAITSGVAHSNCLWIAALYKANNSAYPSPPSGWTSIVSSNAASPATGFTIIRRTSLVSPGDLPLSDVNYSVPGSGAYGAVSAIMSALPDPAANTGAFFAMF